MKNSRLYDPLRVILLFLLGFFGSQFIFFLVDFPSMFNGFNGGQ